MGACHLGFFVDFGPPFTQPGVNLAANKSEVVESLLWVTSSLGLSKLGELGDDLVFPVRPDEFRRQGLRIVTDPRSQAEALGIGEDSFEVFESFFDLFQPQGVER
jgi:hypothetical protein